MLRRLLLTLVVAATTASSGGRHSRKFSAAEFEKLRQEIHLLGADEAEARFAELEPLSSPPPRQDKIDHVVVLFMENRAFDHLFGCQVSGKRSPSSECQHRAALHWC